MAEQISREVVLKYDGNKVGKIQSLSRNRGTNEIPISSFDSGRNEEFLRGRSNTTLSITCILDEEDTDGQVALMSDIEDDDKIRASDFGEFVIGPESPESGDVLYTGNGFPTTDSDEGGDDGDGIRTRTFEIRISGKLERSVES